jgi:hypothetical protein
MNTSDNHVVLPDSRIADQVWSTRHRGLIAFSFLDRRRTIGAVEEVAMPD